MLVGKLRFKGGKGSGNFGHVGRPGKVGGSQTSAPKLLQSFDSLYPNLQVESSSELSDDAKNFLKRNEYKTQDVDELLAVDAYKSTSRELNSDLRAGNDYKNIVTDGLDSALSKSVIDENVSVFRGVSPTVFPADLQIGTIFTDKGFISTTISRKSAWGFSTLHSADDIPTVMQIGLKAGQHALNMDAIFDRGEAELLLPRGTSFRILSDSTEYLIPGNEDSLYRLIKAVPYE